MSIKSRQVAGVTTLVVLIVTLKDANATTLITAAVSDLETTGIVDTWSASGTTDMYPDGRGTTVSGQLYVASVVPNPARFAAEMRRVCIPRGSIVVVNHFTSENLLARFMEKRLARVARHIGFHADFPLDAFRRDSRLSIREVRPSNLLGYWKLLRCVNEKPASNPR